MLKATTSAASGALNIAGTVGVPFVGVAGIVLQDIINTCDEVKIYRVRIPSLTTVCLSLKCREIEKIQTNIP